MGSSLVRRLQAQGTPVLARTYAELDLTQADQVEAFFATEKPTQVYLAAAKVGGIVANNNYPGEFIRDNLAIQTNVIHAAWRHGVQRLLFLGSSCIYWMTVNYREAYGIYACNGILFNHESPVRGETFVTRKITRAIARIALGLQDCLYLGNMSALRDWGHAKDYVEMQWLMLQQEQPEDFVIATGVQYSVRQFVEFAAAELGITLRFEGEGEAEIGVVAAVTGDKAQCKVGDVVVRVDPRYYRPTEVETLLGDPSKAHAKLGWKPKITLAELVKEMAISDYEAARKDALVKLAGFKTFDHHE